MATRIYTPIVPTRPADYGYPATAEIVFASQTDDAGVLYTFHIIKYAGQPSSCFNTAPNGSLLIDTTTPRLYVKNGTTGLCDGTWEYATLS